MIPLIEKRGEARVDSRAIAQALNNQHKNVRELIERHLEPLRGFGVVPFETEKFGRRGRPERYYLLSEDQAYFLLMLSRNTPRAVGLKAKLVLAFREARLKAELHAEYLPGYHDLHQQIHQLAQGTPNERWAHINLNKLINKATGIGSGERAQADVPSKALLITAQIVAARAMHGAADHHDAYRRAKAALEPLSAAEVGG